MKKQLVLPFLLLFSASYLFISCNNKGGGSGEAYTLKMRLAPGDNFKQDMDMTMNMQVEVAGQNMKTDLGIKGLMDFSVSGDSNNLKKIKMTYEKMGMTMKLDAPGMDGMNMDSILNKSNELINGKSVNILVNEKNEIVDVAGFEDIMVNEALDDASKMQIKKMFSKEQINSMLGMMFQMYPDKPVKVGESWEKEIEFPMAEIKMKIKGKYTLKSVKDGVAFIDLKGTFKGKGSMNQNGMAIDMDMDGTQNGQINIGLEDGYLKDSDIKMDMKALTEVMGQKMKMNMKGKYLMKGK
jgi:Family of unknown function (DUF6263)